MLHSEINDGVATVTIDNPPHNILTCTVLESLRASLAALAREPALRVLVLRAGGDNFSAGADVEEHLPPTYEHMIPEFIATVVAVREFPVPVIAAVQGKCLGGGFEIVQPCDLIIATDDAVFGQPEIRLGVMAPAACVLLPRAIGWTRAAELLFTGDTIGAVDAYRVGLLNAVVSADELGERVGELARRIARNSAAALRCVKQTLMDAAADDVAAGLPGAGRHYVDDLMQTADSVEGLVSFVEKRKPVWSHT